jgi:hypothetical protein
MLKARLSSDRSRVLCGNGDDCGAEIAWVLKRGVYADGRWQRGVWFPPGWAARPDGVWAWTSHSVKRRRRGQLPADRVQPGAGPRGPTGWLPANLPVEAKCPDCEFLQTLDPAVLDVAPNIGQPAPDCPPGIPRTLELPEELERWQHRYPTK